MAAAEEMIVLVSQESERIEVSKKAGALSALIQTMTEDNEDDEEVPLLDVKAPTLRKIVEYMEHYKDAKLPEIEKPLRSSKMEQVVPEWDAKFVDAPQETLFELILGANYMDIKPLLDLTCAKVASMIKGKTPEEIRKLFNIENDFTPEEEAQVRDENKWAEET
ncbi:hypothetical protein FNF29_02319 [Cafeteria roenbergensis]|uniref:Uncharacterized protein n=1 Tax=Cafeteria roenbergensis TaxID=33653 RepID=A0A5A8CRM4_CAFRO|nr:hypothetical protein FNF29_02319 [Cafeteria roenbergensis]|eukprot:KAA0154790.1 hypothetical protein FNF29_02319 [Cafeteria roenbergensis]